MNNRPSATVNNSSADLGKTTEKCKFLRENPEIKANVFSETHLTLNEVESKLPKSETAHWYGHSQICPILDLRGLPSDVACQLCQYFNFFDTNKCPYHKQFKPKRIVLMPYEFLNTKYLEPLEPDIVWVEESCYKMKEWREPPPSVIKAQSELLGGFRHDLYLTNPDEIERKLLEKLKEMDPKKAVEMAKIVFNPRPKEIGEYYDRVYAKKPLKVPYLVEVYRYCIEKKANLIITDATFSEHIWKWVFSVHSYLNIGIPLPEPKIEQSPIEKYKESIIYKMGRGWYPRQTLYNLSTLRNICETIEKIARFFRLKTIPIVTFKSVKDYVEAFLSKYNVEILHFGNLRTRNDFQDYTVGFVIGTYNLGSKEMHKIIDDYAPWVENKEQYKITRYKYRDIDAEELRKWYEDAEQYQAIHRFRPLRKPTKVFVWGAIPAQIQRELPVYLVRNVDKLIRSWSRGKHYVLGYYEGINIAEEFIEKYNGKLVPIAEIREYLVSEGFSTKTASKVIKYLRQAYPIRKIPRPRGRPMICIVKR